MYIGKRKERTKTLKKVCIIRSNPVRPDSRVEKEAWSLMDAGYDVHILAWDRDADTGEREDVITVAGKHIPITRIGYAATFGEGFKNIKSYLKFQFHMRKWLKENDFDIVHACDFDTAFFSFGIVRKKNEKFIFDIFDFLYGEPQTFFQHCVKSAQFRLIDSADATIICTEERKKQIFGSKPKRLTVLHNTPFEEQRGDFKFQVEKNNKIKIVYVGILQDYRLLKEIAEVIIESENLELYIGGFGKYEKYFQKMSKQHKNIKFYGRLTYNQTLALEKECDVMIAIYDPKIENHRYAAPNKFYESLMLGKPVVMVKNTGMSQVISENEIGVLINYTKEDFLNGINWLIAHQSEWPMMSEKMKKIYRSKYSWKIMENRLLKLYESLF